MKKRMSLDDWYWWVDNEGLGYVLSQGGFGNWPKEAEKLAKKVAPLYKKLEEYWHRLEPHDL